MKHAPTHRGTERMRTHIFLPALLAAAALNAQAQADSTGLPGDHFSLEGALDLFKKAANLEAFEKALNTETNNVNNLDLNGDGKVDYVRVESRTEGKAFAIVLQVLVNKDEAQDVAVIELEKTGETSAQVQIIGDQELYAANTIVEPYAEGDAKGAKSGPAAPEVFGMWITVNVWAWPCVQWCYGPSFVVWYSPWYWDFYPPWWRPWRHAHWHQWHHHHAHYHAWYRHADSHRNMNAHNLYGHHRKASATVQRNNAARREQAGPGNTNGRQTPERMQPGTQERVQPTQRVAPPAGDPGNVEPRTPPSKTKPTRRQQRATRKATRPAPSPGGNRPSR